MNRHVTVQANHVAVEFVDGLQTRVLEPGRHRRPRRSTHTMVDLREALHTIAGQEVLTSDGAQVKVNAAVRWRVADPVTFLGQSADPLAVLHLAVQVALRDALAGLTLDQVLQRGLDQVDLAAAVTRAATEVGIAVVAVQVKDVMAPAAVREATLDVVTARLRGAAQLEAARAETAALRSLANGAKLLDDHPALAKLRLVQALPIGAQVVLKVDGAEPGTPHT